MSSSPETLWVDGNQRYLTAAVAVVAAHFRVHLGTQAQGESLGDAEEALLAADASLDSPSALESTSQTFGLSSFERSLLVLCAGVELESSLAELCAAASGRSSPDPTFGLALAVLPDAHWSALAPNAPLRRWQLVEVAGGSVTQSPLRIDERVLHHLAGVEYDDPRLAGIFRAAEPETELLPSYGEIAERIAEIWRMDHDTGHVTQLCGDDEAGRRAVAAAAARRLGLGMHAVLGEALPSSPSDLRSALRLVEREAAFSSSATLVELDEADPIDAQRERHLLRALEEIKGVVLLSTRRRRRLSRPTVTFDVPAPAGNEQRLLWRAALRASRPEHAAAIERVSSHFRLSFSTARAAGNEVRARLDGRGGDITDTLWAVAREQTRPGLDELARRIEPRATWDDLVLPSPQLRALAELAAQVRNRELVYERWALGKGSRGLGISVLFAGPTGTGKTLAAEVLAHELHLDLHHIDLAGMVSKYIGETEKNLRRVFDAAEEGGAVLLFDEADALFGRRSEVRDSHDRYANIEISYLLQRMEAYRGLAILTTNMKSALDPAFLRRIRFVVQFPFPDAAQRLEIWKRALRPELPREGVDVARLAQLAVAGGSISDIVVNAAFLAAEAGHPVGMSHLRRAALAEYAKLERGLTEGELAGWP